MAAEWAKRYAWGYATEAVELALRLSEAAGCLHIVLLGCSCAALLSRAGAVPDAHQGHAVGVGDQMHPRGRRWSLKP